jgi:hypothetical protein
MWPSFVRGQLSLNQQAFIEDYPTAERDPVAHAWNIGEKLGFEGLSSLAPLFVVWGAIGSAWWIARDRPGPSRNERKKSPRAFQRIMPRR